MSLWEKRRTDPIGDWSGVLHPIDSAGLFAPKRALTIRQVHQASPAHRAGLRPGWEMLSLRSATTSLGQPPSRLACNENERDLYPNQIFDEIILRDPAGSLYRWDNPNWPFGIVLTPPLDASFMKDVARNQTDREIILDFWKAGQLDAFVAMKPSLRKAVAPKAGLGKLVGALSNAEQRNDLHEVWGWLALAEAQDGQPQAALEAALRARKYRDALQQDSFSGHTLGLEYHACALAHAAMGDRKNALYWAKEAYFARDDVQVLRDLYRTMNDGAATDVPDNHEGHPFAVSYTLPDHDPIGEWPGSGGMVSLAETLKALAPHQILPIMVYGSFRSNYYGNNDLARLAMVHRAFPDLIGAVHVIVSDTYGLDVHHRRWAETICRNRGLPMRILYDQDAEVDTTLAPDNLPQTFILTSDGIVQSTQPWANEGGIWAAVASQQS